MSTSPPTASRDVDVLCLGAPFVSFTETAPGTYLRSVGGDVAVTAIAAARAGARAAVASRIGADVFGDVVADTWEADGIEAAAVIRDPDAPTGHIFSHLTGGGPPEMSGGTAAALMRPGDLTIDAIGAARVLHVSGGLCALSSGARALADAALRAARAVGTRVSCTLALGQPGMAADDARRASLALLARSDVALVHLDDAREVFDLSAPEAILDHVLEMGAQVVSLWMGPAGAWVASNQGRWRIGSVTVLSVDTAGAGSVFDGYFLSGLTAGDDLLTAATRANTAAAMSTARPGIIQAIPLAAEILI